MLFIKILGAALIIFAGFLGGRYVSQNLKRRCDILESIILIASFIKEQIVCFRYEIDVIYKNLLDNGFEKELVKNLTTTDNLQNYLENFVSLNKRDKKLTYELFSNIGMSDIRGEQEHISVYIKLLNAQLEAASQEYLKKEKLYKNIGAFLGVGIAIFLV